MEERETPARDGKDEPPSNSSSYIPLPLPAAPGVLKGSETYVVHFPRDQVYRVPPPENARIAENHRPKNKQKTSNGGGSSGFRRILVPLILVALAISTVTTILVLYNPKYPEFSVKRFRAKNMSSSSNSKHSYSILLQIENPNKRMDLNYGHGTTSLEYKGKVIASGKYSSIKQEAGKGIEVVEILHGTKNSLSTSIKKGLHDKYKKSMTLKIKVPIKISSWVRNSQKDITITCDFKVKKLAKKGTKILSQECRRET